MYRLGESGSGVVTSELGLAQLAGLLSAILRETRRSSITTGQAVATAMGGVTRGAVVQANAMTSPGWLMA